MEKNLTDERCPSQRKHPRLKNYDYSQNGCYFVTIRTKDRQRLLSSVIVGRGDLTPPSVQLTGIGSIVEKYIFGIENAYESVFLDSHVIMPDHIHLLLRIEEPGSGGMGSSRPTLPQVVRALKSMVTKEVGHSIWQTSFYDHVICSEQTYCEVCQYIADNPAKWLERNS